MKMTDAKLRSIRATDQRQELPVDGHKGLYFVIQPSGAKSWAWRGRLNGKTAKKVIGAYPLFGLHDAGSRVGDINRALALGTDPWAEEVAAKEAEAVALTQTGQWLFDRYWEDDGSTLRSGHEIKRLWDRYIAPAVGNKAITDITARDLHECVMAKFHGDAKVTANRMVSLIKRIWKWGTTKGHLTTGMTVDITTRIYKPHIESPRERALDESELRYLLPELARSEGPFARVFELLLLTGLRQDSVVGGRWSEIKGGIWTIPAVRVKAKNGKAKPFAVPLTPQMLVVLDRIARVDGQDRMFPGFRDSRKSLVGVGRPFERVRRRVQKAGARDGITIEHFTNHDFRHTLSTRCNDMREPNGRRTVDRDDIERVMGHVLVTGETRTGRLYDQNEYNQDKLRCLTIWNDYLDTLRTPVEVSLDVGAPPALDSGADRLGARELRIAA